MIVIIEYFLCFSVKCGFHNYDNEMSIPVDPPTHISRLISNRARIISD